MAGRRHSDSDMKKGRGIKSKLRESIADMDDLGFEDPQDIGHPADGKTFHYGGAFTSAGSTNSTGVTITSIKVYDTPDTNALKAISETEDEIRAANYIVLFGGRDLEGIGSPRKNADGTRGEFFTPRTQLESEATKTGRLPIDWEHNTMRGQAVDGVPPGDFLGYVDWKTAKVDDRGVWVERVLNRRNKYVQWIEALIKQGLIGNSSEAHDVRKAANGEILVYPLVRDTFTVQPMEPRMMTQNVITALKALGVVNEDDDSATPQATGAESPAEQSAEVEQVTNKGVLEMTKEELEALLDEREARRVAAEKIEKERQDKEDARVKAAIEAEQAKNQKELADLKAQYAASGRLPLGEAPVQARFAGTRKYDGLSAADLAFAGALLNAGKEAGIRGAKGLSADAAQALAIKVAEDKTEGVDMTGQEVSLGEQGRAHLKALGVEPSAVLDAAKANEVNYSTLANFGDEWVGVEYSRRLWPVIRAATFVLGKLPSIEVPQGVESVIVPLESGDPTFYKVAQTTDENATTGTPNATVPSSRMGTARNTLTVAKGGARTQYTGEMAEDSLVPWASQLRQQLERATAEQLEHAVIDGDTATGATTNINDIGGTPAGTEFFLLIDGLRKSPLVTTTANSRSGGGSLVDTDFMDTAWLLGTAGLTGADPTKVDFIVDPNVAKKAAYLASVKTRDVFQNATLENGLLSGIWSYKVFVSWFMHYMSTTRKANTAGKVDQDTVNNNTTGSILAVRWDQWLFGWKRRIQIETVRVPRADITEITATLRFGMIQRDTEGSAITYNVGV